MTTYNTGNPIGSTDSRDRLDNTENMDYLENSTTELTHADRLGTVRKTRHGMEVEHDTQMQSFENDFDGRLAGMAFTRVGSFTTGAMLTDMRQVLVWEVSQGGDGHEYGWTGTFPKVVAAGATPATSGGIGAGAWVDRTEATLRAELSSVGGVDLVSGAMTERDIGLKPIHKFNSFNASDIYAAWLESINKYGYVYLSGGSTTQYVLNGTHSDLYQSFVISDTGVTLVVSDDQYPLLGSLKIKGDLKIKTASINTSISASKIDGVSSVARLKSNLLHSSIVNFSDCHASSNDGDTFTLVSFGGTSQSAVLFPLTISSTTGFFTQIAIGESISAHLRVETGAAEKVGLLLRCTNGWIKILGLINSTTYNVTYKQIGGSVVTASNLLPLDPNLDSYAAGRATLGAAVSSPTEFYFLINGTSLTKITSTVGDILEIGFVFDGVAVESSGRVTGLCAYKPDKLLYGYGPLNISIYGDSTADEYAGSFDKYLPQLLDGENASRSVAITNHAVSGQTFQQQFDLLKANGPENAYIICMVAGTNDIQSGESADTFALKVAAFIDYCESNGRIPMLVEPWLWYPKSSIGGNGQASSHYQDGAELREAGKRVALGRGAIYVSTTHELPAPVPSYFGTDIDPLLRDDIHQSQLGYRLYAELIASHIIEYMGRISKTGMSIPTQWKSSSVTSIANSSVKENGFSGSFSVSGFANGASILSLPRWCRPPRNLAIPAAFTTSGGALSACYAMIASDGVVTVDGLSQTNSTIVLSVNW